MKVLIMIENISSRFYKFTKSQIFSKIEKTLIISNYLPINILIKEL